MSQEFSPLIKPEELMLLKRTTKLVIVDARSGQGAKEKYTAEHIEGALHVDLDHDLAHVKPDPSQGGRHPLPELDKFSKVLTHLGISPQSHVIIYDDKSGANAAARFWWMLKSVGHEKVQVLDGGLSAALKAGLPLSAKEEIPATTEVYPAKKWLLPLVDINEVEKASHNSDFLIIDVRENDRYKGEREPIDLIAGHIPGAINAPYLNNLDANGFYLSPQELKNNYSKIIGDTKPENIIVHCGSGVTACHTILAMASAGIEIPKLYVGSWSEWSRSGKPIAKGNKN